MQGDYALVHPSKDDILSSCRNSAEGTRSATSERLLEVEAHGAVALRYQLLYVNFRFSISHICLPLLASDSLQIF